MLFLSISFGHNLDSLDMLPAFSVQSFSAYFAFILPFSMPGCLSPGAVGESDLHRGPYLCFCPGGRMVIGRTKRCAGLGLPDFLES